MLMPIVLILLLGIGVALFRRSARAVRPGRADDAPQRLLRWSVGLLPAGRQEWGQAMLGELDHIEGRRRRWSFSIGGARTAMLLSPGGRTGAAVLGMVAVAVGSIGLHAAVIIRYGLGDGSWAWAAIVLALLVAFMLAATVLLRRPGVAGPGLLGGLFVALAWLAMSGFTFYGVVAAMTAKATIPVLLIVVPAAVGVAGTLLGGSAVTGRRVARLAAVSAGLGLYLYATLAVAVLGAGGPAGPAGQAVSSIVGDRLGNNIIADLMLLPLATATVGWAAAAATARVRTRLAASADSAPITADDD